MGTLLNSFLPLVCFCKRGSHGMCAPLPQPQRHNCRIYYARGCSAELAAAVGAACRHTHAAAITSAAQVLCSRLHACPQVAAAQRSSGETHGGEEVCTLALQISSAGVQNMALDQSIQRSRNKAVYLNNKEKYGEKEKRNQRHNLTVLSWLPIARSGAVG